jgi:hypothetical protein
MTIFGERLLQRLFVTTALTKVTYRLGNGRIETYRLDRTGKDGMPRSIDLPTEERNTRVMGDLPIPMIRITDGEFQSDIWRTAPDGTFALNLPDASIQTGHDISRRYGRAAVNVVRDY